MKKRKMGVGTSHTRKSALAPLWLALFIQASKTANLEGSRGLHKCTYMEIGGHVNRAMKKLPLRAKHIYQKSVENVVNRSSGGRPQKALMSA